MASFILANRPEAAAAASKAPRQQYRWNEQYRPTAQLGKQLSLDIAASAFYINYLIPTRCCLITYHIHLRTYTDYMQAKNLTSVAPFAVFCVILQFLCH